MDFNMTVPIVKSDEALRVVYGWASVIEDQGRAVVDRQGDVITPDELIKAAHGFMRDSRKGKEMHRDTAVGEVVESIVLTRDVQDALGVNLDKVGWYIAIKILDDTVWNRVQSGEYRAFSIGGRAKRILQTGEAK
jgi:hypothetical protein